MSDPYRSNRAALEHRREALAAELEELSARCKRLEELELRRNELVRELERVSRALAEAEPRRLPMLEGLRIANPCAVSWDAMTGDERVRSCAICNKSVFNLSAMSKEEVEALLSLRKDPLCVRFYRRSDGTVMTSDCPVRVREKRRRRLAIVVAGAGIVALSVFVSNLRPKRSVVMGQVALGPPEIAASPTGSGGSSLPPESHAAVPAKR